VGRRRVQSRIGVLLIVVAFRLGMDSRELLIGRSADPKCARGDPGRRSRNTPGVDGLLGLQTMHVGPDSLNRRGPGLR